MLRVRPSDFALCRVANVHGLSRAAIVCVDIREVLVHLRPRYTPPELLVSLPAMGHTLQMKEGAYLQRPQHTRAESLRNARHFFKKLAQLGSVGLGRNQHFADVVVICVHQPEGIPVTLQRMKAAVVEMRSPSSVGYQVAAMMGRQYVSQNRKVLWEGEEGRLLP